MKKIFLLTAAVAGIASLSSCTKEQNQSEGEKVTITVSFPEVVDSKVAMEEGQQALDLKWENDDKLTIVGNTTGEFTVASISEDGKTATFTGNAVEGDKFDVILSDRGVDYLSRDLVYEYKQSSNGATDHMMYEAVLKGVDSYQDVAFTEAWATAHGGTFAESGCLKLHIQLPEGCTSAQKVWLVAPYDMFHSTHAEDSPMVYMRSLTFAAVQIPDNGILEVYGMTSMAGDVIPANTRMMVIINGDTKYVKEFTIGNQMEITPGKRNVITLNSANWETYNATDLSHAFGTTTLGAKGLKANWSFPYVNISDPNHTPDESIDQQFRGGAGQTWLYPLDKTKDYIKDSSFDWSQDSEYPMVGIINMGASYIVNALHFNETWYSSKSVANGKVEFWLSNDESNDSQLGTHLTQKLTKGSTSSDVEGDWNIWKAKKWVKFNEASNPKGYVYFKDKFAPFKAKYIMIVLHSNTGVIGASELNAQVYGNK